jgi:hypothetical protein
VGATNARQPCDYRHFTGVFDWFGRAVFCGYQQFAPLAQQPDAYVVGVYFGACSDQYADSGDDCSHTFARAAHAAAAPDDYAEPESTDCDACADACAGYDDGCRPFARAVYEYACSGDRDPCAVYQYTRSRDGNPDADASSGDHRAVHDSGCTNRNPDANASSGDHRAADYYSSTAHFARRDDCTCCRLADRTSDFAALSDRDADADYAACDRHAANAHPDANQYANAQSERVADGNSNSNTHSGVSTIDFMRLLARGAFFFKDEG